jgi:3'-phosphoadenosine 5'-phosphosulfate sulfotransferase (PAPS reductase)/FAD synthetase
LKPPIHVVAVSGGKDSAACAVLAARRVPRDRLMLVFMDTGNEHPETYAYLNQLSDHLGLPIEHIKADFTQSIADRRRAIARDQRTGRDKTGRKIRWSNKRKREALSVLHATGNPFLDMALVQGMFPRNTHRFCTRYLKIELFDEAFMDLHERQPLIVWQGTKNTDSDKRAHLRRMERHAPGWWYFRPIVDWTDAQVFDFLRDTGTPINPLYNSGFSRVSCAPCIYSWKSEIVLLAEKYPEQIDRIREWEHLVGQASRTGFAPFFGGKQIPSNPKNERTRRSIDGAVKWARIDFRKNKKASYEEAFGETCSAGHGLCE